MEGAFWNTCRLNNCEVFTLGLVSACVGRGGGGATGSSALLGEKGWARCFVLPCPARPGQPLLTPLCTPISSPALWPRLCPASAPPLPRPSPLVPPRPGAARAASRKQGAGRAAPWRAGPAGSHVFAGGGLTWRGDWRPGRAVRGLPGRWRTRWPPDEEAAGGARLPGPETDRGSDLRGAWGVM